MICLLYFGVFHNTTEGTGCNKNTVLGENMMLRITLHPGEACRLQHKDQTDEPFELVALARTMHSDKAKHDARNTEFLGV